MDKKIELQVLNISNSQAQVGAYALVLGEVGGERQLPIIIGPAEAQATAICLKGVKAPRPLTHDLFYTCLNVLGTKMLRVLIYKAKEGVFYSYIYLQKDEEIIRIDSRTSDAIALAVRADCPIFIYESILEREYIRLDDSDQPDTEQQEEETNDSDNVNSLEQALEQAIKEENYELAARLRDEINRHCVRVLRLNIGDEITLTDGNGSFYRAEITAATNKRCLVKILETIPQEPLWSGHLHIAMAPTKNMDRNEWFAEKATEIGFDELTFLNCRFSERKVIKMERIEKIVVSAIKQSLKARLPRLNEMTDFDKFITQEFTGQKFIAHCYEGEKPLLKNILKPGEDALVLIGPEGDFSEEEVTKAIEKGFQPISLGKSRLRTETAALVATMVVNSE